MYRQSIFSNLPPVTKNLLIVNLLIWVATWLLGRKVGLDIADFGGLHYFSSPLFNPAQLFTYMFIHASFMHLFMNMFALFMFGGLLERTLGSARVLLRFVRRWSSSYTGRRICDNDQQCHIAPHTGNDR